MIFQQELIASLRRNAGRTAIEGTQRSLTYEQLSNTAGAVTASLLKAGLGREEMVGIFLNDRVDFICTVIGIVNARCVFVPIDPSLPEARLRLLIQQLDLQYLISSQNETIARHGIHIPNEFHFEDLANAEPAVTFPEYDAEDSVYVYFTSGSTGTPKAVVGKNCSLLQFLQWEISTFNLNEATRVSQFISPYFDASLRDIFAPLLAGGTACIPPQGKDLLLPANITRWINESRVSVIHCVPSFFRAINHESITSDDYAELNYVMMSGEKIIPAELQHWYELFGGRIQLVNFYGATESTMIRTYYLIQPQDARLAKMPIGKPIWDTELAVLDRSMKPCAPLVPGDLYIVTDYLTKGYFNNPALTNERFVTINASKPAYKTGDKARILADGSVDLLGREDREIKLRGIRIGLDEIEHVLSQAGFVKNAAVVAQKTAGGDEVLNAFIIRSSNAGGIDLVTAAKEYLLERLPEYMTPAGIYEVAEFPLLSNGKINFRELANSVAKRAITLPANETEQQLLGIWKNVLGDREISTEDSFHSIGGNSISIMKLIGRVYKEFSVRISLEDIFMHPTIKGQAGVIKKLRKDDSLHIPAVEKRAFYHISSAQGRVYYNYALNNQRISYNLTMTWEIRHGYDYEKLLRVLHQLAARHEGLRTRFTVEDGHVVQVVLDKVDIDIEQYQCGDEEVNDVIVQFVRPFDLGRAPLMRAALIQTTTGRTILVADLHHIICDGMSQRILRSDFYKLYYNQPLEPLSIQYKDYAEWEYNYKHTHDYLLLRQFWLRSFEGRIPQLNLPVSNARFDDLSEKGHYMHFEISKAAMQPVLEYMKREELTSSTAFFSIYYLFLSQLTGQDDITVGVASAGRTQQELESVVGMFVKTLPVRYRLDTKACFDWLMVDLHKYLIQAFSNQAYDLDDIVRELNKNKAVKIDRLFNAGFVFQNFQDDNSEQTEDFVTYRFVNNGAKNALTLYVIEKPESFYLRLEYSHAYFTREDVALLIMQFKSLVSSITGNIHSPVAAIIGGNKPAAVVAEDDISFNF